MEEIIKDELREGEKVLWSGSPEAFETLDVTNKKPIIKNAIITFAIVITLCILYTAYALSHEAELNPIFIVVLLAAAFLISINYLSVSSKLRKTQYIVTDQRIIYITAFPKSLEYAQIKEVEFKADADGHSSVLFGSNAIKAKAHKWRSLAVLDAYLDEESGYCTRFVMYALPDAENALNIIKEHISK